MVYESLMAPSGTDRAAYQRLTKQIHPSLLGRCLGITRQAVYDWGQIVPDRYVLQCSVLSGIPAEELRPQLVREMQKVRTNLIVGEPAQQ